MAQKPDSYKIDLPQFVGPFDLLLFFIERDELDIYDIPIAKIARDFLDYLHTLEAMNIDMASEFIVVAAQLMKIKAKMLLPRREVDEEGREIDPRAELVQKLLEYKRYKSVLDDLRQLEDNQSFRFQRGYATQELKQLADGDLIDLEFESLTMYKLLRAFQNVLRRSEAAKSKPVHTVYNWSYSMTDQQNHIRTLLTTRDRLSFETVFEHCENRIHAIIIFLGMLELLNLHQLSVVQGEGINNFWLTMPTPELSEADNEWPAQQS